MIDTKKLNKLVTRIKKSNATLSVMDTVMIMVDLESLTLEELNALAKLCAAKKVAIDDFPLLTG
jgi:hypothetical protein